MEQIKSRMGTNCWKPIGQKKNWWQTILFICLNKLWLVSWALLDIFKNFIWLLQMCERLPQTKNSSSWSITIKWRAVSTSWLLLALVYVDTAFLWNWNKPINRCWWLESCNISQLSSVNENTDKKTYKQKIIYNLTFYEFIFDTNWNKQTYWKDQGEGHKKKARWLVKPVKFVPIISSWGLWFITKCTWCLPPTLSTISGLSQTNDPMDFPSFDSASPL